jgi:hypothetical protein
VNVIYDQSDNSLVLSSLTNGLTSALIGGATVTCQLKTATGATVSGLATGVSWPLIMVAGSATGTYRVTLPYSLALTTGTTYYAEVVADGGAGLRRTWRYPVKCMMGSS